MCVVGWWVWTHWWYVCCRVVGVDSLVVADSDLVWVLHVDAVCLSLDGNLLDTCCLAAVAALSTSKLERS